MSNTNTTGVTLASYGRILCLILVSYFSAPGAFLGGGGWLSECLRGGSRLGYEFHGNCILFIFIF